MLPVIAAAFGAYFTTAEPCPWPNTCPGTLPKMKQTWLMNLSTIIMPCNDTGFTDPQSTLGWGIVDFDWSNSKGTGTADGWAKHRPMDDEELLFKQVWVYRNTVYGYPWYTDVRKTLEDPAYVPWYFKFKPNGPWYSKKCDSAQPDICSDLYHSQEQTPGYPSGDVVNGQTFQDWFIHSYVLNEVGSSPLVSGFFWDDVWNPQCNIHDQVPQTCQDMGLTTDDLIQLTKDYEINMAALRTAVLNMGKFAWQMLWTGGPDDNIGGTGLNPLVQQNGCAATLRRLCNATSPAQTRAMAFGLSTNNRDPSQLTDLKQDLANFLLIRGPYSWLGHGWLGCSKQYFFPPEFNVDYGVPSELCKETAENSGIFTRDFSKSTVQMDCNKWEGTITMK